MSLEFLPNKEEPKTPNYPQTTQALITMLDNVFDSFSTYNKGQKMGNAMVVSNEPSRIVLQNVHTEENIVIIRDVDDNSGLSVYNITVANGTLSFWLHPTNGMRASDHTLDKPYFTSIPGFNSANLLPIHDNPRSLTENFNNQELRAMYGQLSQVFSALGIPLRT